MSTARTKKGASAPAPLKHADRKIIERFIKEDTQRGLEAVAAKKRERVREVTTQEAQRQQGRGYTEGPLTEAQLALIQKINEQMPGIRAAYAAFKTLVNEAWSLGIRSHYQSIEQATTLIATGLYETIQVEKLWQKVPIVWKELPSFQEIEADYMRQVEQVKTVERQALLELVVNNATDAKAIIDAYQKKIASLLEGQALPPLKPLSRSMFKRLEASGTLPPGATHV
jgi:hypothetical protein